MVYRQSGCGDILAVQARAAETESCDREDSMLAKILQDNEKSNSVGIHADMESGGRVREDDQLVL